MLSVNIKTFNYCVEVFFQHLKGQCYIITILNSLSHFSFQMYVNQPNMKIQNTMELQKTAYICWKLFM